jgi:16S rRNA C1402 (ribose-2'-O) methylase RsmI
MPISAYYQGHGEEVMADMKERYGEKKGESVFYATANEQKQNPEDEKKKKKSSTEMYRDLSERKS